MSSDEDEDCSSLFGEIVSCRPEQVAHWDHRRESPTYMLLRTPNNINELILLGDSVAIWRDNETLTYVSPLLNCDAPVIDERYMFVQYSKFGPTLTIEGSSDEAVVETTDFFFDFADR